MLDSMLVKRSRATTRVSLLRVFSVLLIAAMLISPSGALAAPGGNGFTTTRPPMLIMADIPGVVITPLLTVGDVLPGGFRFEAIPDGISLRKYKGDVEVFVNHETSKVPFPYVTAGPTAANSANDFDNAQVSRLLLNRKTGGVLDGSFLIDSSLGFQRFCSNYIATAKEGFEHDILFTNEEAIDYVFREEASWPPAIGDPDEKQIGLVVAVDLKTGQHYPIYGMGRFNHENAVPIPQHNNKVAVLSGDDTFTSGPLTIPTGGVLPAGTRFAQSQLYSYIADKSDDVLNDEGDLWAFVSDDPSFNDYYDFSPTSPTPQSISGYFIQVPKNIATGLTDPDDPNSPELKAADLGYPLPPTNGSWQRDLRNPAIGVDGPQWVLEYWSQLNNVFQFVRVEDLAYDKRPGTSNVVYIVDSGRGRTAAQHTASPDTPFPSTNGRVWKMVLDPNDPTIVTSLSIFVEGDDNPVKTLNEVHQPDNIETTLNGILLTEDPGSSQQFPATPPTTPDPNRTTARLWFVPFSGTPAVAAKIDQSADGVLPANGGTDVGPAPFTVDPSIGNLGAWETTGIVDASAAFGPGYFLINVQAHTLWIEKADGPNNFAPAGADFTYKREGGQLLLIKIPGL